MILHTVGYPAVKLCNFVCVRGDFGRSPGQARSKVSEFARKFCFFLLITYMFTVCTYQVQEGGVLFLCFALYVIG